jgi:hypothetical protein
VTKNYDDRTHRYYFQKTRTNGQEIVIIPADDYDELADDYRHMENKLYRYNLVHSVARDITQIMIIVRLLLASLLGLMLPLLFTSSGKTSAFIMFYAMLFLTLVLSLFIPSNEIDASEMVDHFIQKK